MSQPRAPRTAAVCRAAGAAAVTTALALALSACGSEDDASSSGAETQFVPGTGEITQVDKEKRTAAPDIEGETVDGGRLALSDYRGKIVVLNVWGSWCAPCRAEAPNLVKVAEDTEDEGVRFVGINTRDLDVANAKAFDRTYGVEYPSLYDPSGKLILKFPEGSLNPKSIPSTLILDTEGRIAARALKPLGEQELRDALDPVLAEQRAEK